MLLRQWAALLAVLGSDSGPAGLMAHADRLARPGEVDDYLGQLTAGWDAGELAAALQRARISAYPVQDCSDLRADDNLRAFGFFRSLDQSECGPMPYDGPAYRLSRTPGQQTAAPNLGEHTDEVLSGLLGIGAAELDSLRAARILY